MIQQVISVLRGLARVVETYSTAAKKDRTKARGEILDVNTLMSRVGGANDAVNVIELLAYLKESKLARKVSGFAEVLAEEREKAEAGKPKRSAAARHASIAAFHSVEAFLLSLSDARDDGRVIMSLESDAVVIKYVLLNPAERFAEVVASARSVILAGGTMEPISDLFTQLFPEIPKNRFATLSCAHVIPPQNLLTQVVSRGPRKADFEFKFANREDPNLIADLGAALQSALGLIPDGVVVFLPSYAFLDKLKATWGGEGGLLDKFDQKKQVRLWCRRSCCSVIESTFLTHRYSMSLRHLQTSTPLFATMHWPSKRRRSTKPAEIAPEHCCSPSSEESCPRVSCTL
jgi:chromosome transmission fidelity protein 1